MTPEQLLARCEATLATTLDPSAKLHQLSVLSLEYRRQRVDNTVRQMMGTTVRDGLFKGMHYLPEAAGSLYTPKILGVYEQEVAAAIQPLAFDRFVDVGCAEGYFAVGVLHARPHVRTHAFDTDPHARGLCTRLAALNGVSDRLELGEFCDPATLHRLARPGTLVMIDIEGGELELLKDGAPADCDLIVESHAAGNGTTLAFLTETLGRTHDVRVISQSGRDYSVYPEFAHFGQLDRFLTQWEGRGHHPWVLATARRSLA
jgi:hypothetical protein